MNTWEAELVAAIEAKNEKAAIQILENGFPINYHISISDINGNLYLGHTTTLHVAWQFELFELINYVLKNKARIESTDFEGRTPFLLSWELGRLNVMKLLTEHGANILARDFEGNGALHLAVINLETATVEFLIKNMNFRVDETNDSD
jgi:ankyrin repeat protein